MWWGGSDHIERARNVMGISLIRFLVRGFVSERTGEACGLPAPEAAPGHSRPLPRRLTYYYCSQNVLRSGACSGNEITGYCVRPHVTTAAGNKEQTLNRSAVSVVVKSATVQLSLSSQFPPDDRQAPEHMDKEERALANYRHYLMDILIRGKCSGRMKMFKPVQPVFPSCPAISFADLTEHPLQIFAKE